MIDTRPSLIGLCCEKDGSQAQLSLDQMCADVSPHHQWPFWKWRARGTEICHVEQSRRRRWGCRNQVTNLIPLVTIYCPWQIGSLLKRGTEECSHLNQHNNYKYPLYICLPVYACTQITGSVRVGSMYVVLCQRLLWGNKKLRFVSLENTKRMGCLI